MKHSRTQILGRFGLGLILFATLIVAILSWSPKTLFDFDASHYVTLAHDLDRYHTFSNGLLDKVDSTQTQPQSGMFFGPLYPAIIALVMKFDDRFKRAVVCVVTNDARKIDFTLCERYARPMLIIHALFLALGVFAIAAASEIIFERGSVFWLAGFVAVMGVICESELFSFVMTESVTFGLYAIFALCCIRAWKMSWWPDYLFAGVVLGLLCLNRPSYAVLAPVGIVLCGVAGHLQRLSAIRSLARAAIFVAGLFVVLAPWIARNYVSVGKLGLSEEYGSAALVERFEFDTMTPREFGLAFAYCVPVIGSPIVGFLFGEDAIHRFTWNEPDSFFAVGRAHRDQLVEAHGKLDPFIRSIAEEELGKAWWRYLLVSLPLAWCGTWVGGLASLLLVPGFVWAAVRAPPGPRLLLLLYALPCFAMLGLHALVANQYTRYNLQLIGPFAAACAWILSAKVPAIDRVLRRARLV